MGPLALMAKDAGMTVFGSDAMPGAVTNELVANGIKVYLGEQDGEFLKARAKNEGVDWFVYTSALPEDHPELLMAKKLKIKHISKRDELISYLVKKLKLKMIAVAGTHGKTTTTAMIIWACMKLGIPVSYLIGTTLPFAEAGKYDPKSEYFIYEADEYDRNFLAYHPWLAAIPVVTYDHPDIYPTVQEYQDAFRQFERQSETVVKGDEIAADVDLAGEEAERRGLKGVVVVYEPHQNIRQSELADDYAEAFEGVARLYWLPTYLTREDPSLKVLTPADFIERLAPASRKVAEAAELNDKLAAELLKWHEKGYLVLLMTAGPADLWLRKLVYAGNQESAATQFVHAPRDATENAK